MTGGTTFHFVTNGMRAALERACPYRKPNTADDSLRIGNNRLQWTIFAG
jgi:hypothetical protein